MADFEVRVEDAGLYAALDALQARADNLTPAMREISQDLADDTEEAFATEGFGRWPQLAPSTVADRGGDAHPILQRSGQLAARVHPFYSATEAGLGVALIYAAIHQFGGQAGRGRKVRIPARPYLPVDADGNLTDTARVAVLATIYRHLAG